MLINDLDRLKLLRARLKQGNYDSTDIMGAWIVVDELIKMKAWQKRVFEAHPNIDRDIEELR